MGIRDKYKEVYGAFYVQRPRRTNPVRTGAGLSVSITTGSESDEDMKSSFFRSVLSCKVSRPLNNPVAMELSVNFQGLYGGVMEKI
ncbi:unnamed protein product [Urochloa humidicola]